MNAFEICNCSPHQPFLVVYSGHSVAPPPYVKIRTIPDASTSAQHLSIKVTVMLPKYLTPSTVFLILTRQTRMGRNLTPLKVKSLLKVSSSAILLVLLFKLSNGRTYLRCRKDGRSSWCFRVWEVDYNVTLMVLLNPMTIM